MAKDQATGLVLRGGILHWTTLRRTKGSASAVVDSRAEPLELEAGRSADPSRLSEGDRVALLSKLRAIRGSLQPPVTMALSSAQVLMRVVDLPTIDTVEVRNMVELQVDKISPFPTESAITAYEILKQTDVSSLVVAATALRKTIETTGSILTEAGITPRRVDVEPMCWWRLLADAGAIPDSGCHVVILKDLDTCAIVAVRDGLPVIFRSMGNVADVSDEELCSELDYTLTSLESEQGISRADSVLLWHRGDGPMGLVDMLGERFQLAVEAKSLETLPPLSEGIARRALDHGQQGLNLAVPEWQAGQKVVQLRKNLIRASLAIVAIWLTCVAGFLGFVQFEKKRLADMEKYAASLVKPEKEAIDARALLLATEQYTERKTSALECLREVTSVKNATIEFEQFKYENDKRSEVVLVGETAQDKSGIFDFQKALSESKLFSKISPGPISSSQGKSRFTITLDLPRRGK